jgi:hypothetical protein
MLEIGLLLTVDHTTGCLGWKADIGFIGKAEVVDGLMQGIVNASELELHRHKSFVQWHPAVAFEVRMRRRFLNEAIPDEPLNLGLDSTAVKEFAEVLMESLYGDGRLLLLVRYPGEQIYAQLRGDGSGLSQA